MAHGFCSCQKRFGLGAGFAQCSMLGGLTVQPAPCKGRCCTGKAWRGEPSKGGRDGCLQVLHWHCRLRLPWFQCHPFKEIGDCSGSRSALQSPRLVALPPLFAHVCYCLSSSRFHSTCNWDELPREEVMALGLAHLGMNLDGALRHRDWMVSDGAKSGPCGPFPLQKWSSLGMH